LLGSVRFKGQPTLEGNSERETNPGGVRPQAGAYMEMPGIQNLLLFVV